MPKAVAELSGRRFVKSMTMHVDHRLWQGVYHAETPAGTAYVKFSFTNRRLHRRFVQETTSMSKAKHHPCLNCEQSDMELLTKDVTIELDGLTRLVPRVKGWHCPVCGEIEFVGEGSAKRYAAERDARQREELARIRKRLKLTQAQAAAITGGGPNAFSRYERGKARPVAAVINLFRLLDKHPELLAELRVAG